MGKKKKLSTKRVLKGLAIALPAIYVAGITTITSCEIHKNGNLEARFRSNSNLTANLEGATLEEGLKSYIADYFNRHQISFEPFKGMEFIASDYSLKSVLTGEGYSGAYFPFSGQLRIGPTFGDHMLANELPQRVYYQMEKDQKADFLEILANYDKKYLEAVQKLSSHLSPEEYWFYQGFIHDSGGLYTAHRLNDHECFGVLFAKYFTRPPNLVLYGNPDFKRGYQASVEFLAPFFEKYKAPAGQVIKPDQIDLFIPDRWARFLPTAWNRTKIHGGQIMDYIFGPAPEEFEREDFPWEDRKSRSRQGSQHMDGQHLNRHQLARDNRKSPLVARSNIRYNARSNI